MFAVQTHSTAGSSMSRSSDDEHDRITRSSGQQQPRLEPDTPSIQCVGSTSTRSHPCHSLFSRVQSSLNINRHEPSRNFG